MKENSETSNDWNETSSEEDALDDETDDVTDASEEIVTTAPAPVVPPEGDAVEGDAPEIAPVMYAPTEGVSSPDPSATVSPTASVEATPAADSGYAVGICDQAEGAHASSVTSEPVGEPTETCEPEEGDKTYHKVTTRTTLLYKCAEDHDGKKLTWTATRIDTTYAPHDFDEATGTCRLCGYACPHTGDWDAETGKCKNCGKACAHETWEPVYEYDEFASQHACATCGKAEAHKFKIDDSGATCEICSYACPHENCRVIDTEYIPGTPSEGKPLYEEYRENNDLSHMMLGTELDTIQCYDCGYTYKEYSFEVEDGYVDEPHEYEGGVCTLCGHKCAHDYDDGEAVFPNLTTKKTVVTGYKQKDESRHTVVAQEHVITHCPFCDSEISDEKKDASYTEAHEIESGKCAKCGYVVPAQAPEFEKLPTGEALHGVKPEDDLRMGVALAKAVTELTESYGPEALVEIESADKLLTSDESEAFAKLSPVDRVMVLLQILGYGSEESNAAQALDLSLSPEAQALLASIHGRLDTMSEADAQAFSERLQRYFPVVDGKIALTLVVDADGRQLERYIFEQVEGVWTLCSVEVAR